MANAKIGAKDFAEYVDWNRKLLIEHCNKNGKQLSENTSLGEAVSNTQTISNSVVSDLERKHVVTFVDIDGTILKEEAVETHGKVTPPETPSYDSEFLEFSYWEFGVGDINDVTHDMVCGPFYRVKEQIEVDGMLVRPTILKCGFYDPNYLTISISYAKTNKTPALYISWGDGAVDTVSNTSGTLSHTYSSTGSYIIKTYSADTYNIKKHSSGGVFGESHCSAGLTEVYFGDNLSRINNIFSVSHRVKVVVFPEVVKIMEGSTGALSRAVKAVVLPKQIENTIYGGVAESCYALEYIIIPKEFDQSNAVGTVTHFDNCHRLKKVIINKDIRVDFTDCWNLEYTTARPSRITVDNYPKNCYKLKQLDLSNVTEISYGMPNMISIENLYLTKTLTNLVGSGTGEGSRAFGNWAGLKSLTMLNNPEKCGVYAFYGLHCLETLSLPQDFSHTINLQNCYCLSKNSLIGIAKALKNLTGETAKTITFDQNLYQILVENKLNTEGEEVAFDTPGALNLIEFMQAKNWTVTIA